MGKEKEESMDLKAHHKRAMKEYLDIIDTKNTEDEKVEVLGKIIKSEQRTVLNIVQTALIVIMLLVVIGAQIEGYYARKDVQIVNLCDTDNLSNELREAQKGESVIADIIGQKNKVRGVNSKILYD
jgi:hypothetical protein